MFHVKHPKVLHLPIVSRETLEILIYQGFARRSTTPGRNSGGAKPAFSRSSGGQREGSGEGGSETINDPPFFRRGLASGAVTSGPANPLHTTTSYCPRWSGSFPRSTTSAVSTVTLSVSPMAETPLANASIRVARLSTRVRVRSGRSTAMIKPGTPAPVPMSITEEVPVGSAATNWRACSITSSMGLLPSVPSRCAALSTSSSDRFSGTERM